MLGIRPHTIELADRAFSDANILPATLIDTAPVGRDVEADFVLAGQAIKAVLPLEAEVAESRAVRLPPEHCFFFAPDGARLG